MLPFSVFTRMIYGYVILDFAQFYDGLYAEKNATCENPDVNAAL